MMRVSQTWILGVLCAICCAQAADPPKVKRKSGLWEMTTVHDGGPPSSLKACIDEKTDELFDFYLEHGITSVGFNVEEIEGPHTVSSLQASDTLQQRFEILAVDELHHDERMALVIGDVE